MTEHDDSRFHATQTSRGYDILAERAESGLEREGSPWGDSFFQEYYSWPATRTLLPDVGDERVLIAGCGRGDHVDWFLDNGATVVGIDASERAIRTARDRFGSGVTLHRADLTEPLGFADDTFDLVFSHLVMGHIEEWRPVFEEFRRVLAARGTLVFTTIHPQYLRRHDEVTNSYETTEIVVSWPGAEIPAHYRPMNAVLTPLLAAGFRLDDFEEPTPQDSYEEYAPERYENAMQSPEICCIRAFISGRQHPMEP